MSLLESNDPNLKSITKDNHYLLDNETFITNVLICSLTDEELTHNVNMLYEKAKSVNIDVKILKNRLEDCAKKLNIVLPKHTACLKVISAPDLQKANLPPVKFLINDILPEGTSMISAPSKIGKSWFVLDMGLSIASGMPFMKYNTNIAGVLYLALEDSLSRLQNRMNKVLNGTKAPEHFYFTTESPTLDDGLIEVLEEHLKSFPETKLIIIDTLQKIRGQALPRESAYAQDYREMAVLKSFADKHGISTFFVHHTRKMKDEDDAFNMVSGTNGIMGAADTIFVMTKNKRDDDNAILHITGRDVQQINDMVTFNKDIWKWEKIGDANWINQQREKLEFEQNPIVRTIQYAIETSKNGWWSGKASELLELGEFVTGRAISENPRKLGGALKKFNESRRFEELGNIKMEIANNGSGGKTYSFHKLSSENLDGFEEIECNSKPPF